MGCHQEHPTWFTSFSSELFQRFLTLPGHDLTAAVAVLAIFEVLWYALLANSNCFIHGKVARLESGQDYTLVQIHAFSVCFEKSASS